MTQVEFITAYAQAAVDSQKETQVPALFTLGQAGLESVWGLYVFENNFFGIKADSSWTGNKQLLRTHEILDDPEKYKARFPEVLSVTPTANGKYDYYVRDYFRSYDSPAEGFTDHGNFLVNNSRYAEAFKYADDPIKFSNEIAKAGYATAPNYAQSLASSILQVIQNIPAEIKSVFENIEYVVKNNGVRTAFFLVGLFLTLALLQEGK